MFININSIEKKNMQFDKNNLVCNILISNSPQYRMAYDLIGKNLYTGQNDGKINKWDLSKVIYFSLQSLPIGIFDLEKELKIIENSKENNEKNLEELNKKDYKDSDFKEIKSDRKNKSKKSYLKKKKDDNSLGEGVTALVVIAKIQVLAAAYLNGKIILWDILQSKIRKTYDNLKTVMLINLKRAYLIQLMIPKRICFSAAARIMTYMFSTHILNSQFTFFLDMLVQLTQLFAMKKRTNLYLQTSMDQLKSGIPNYLFVFKISILMKVLIVTRQSKRRIIE